MILLLFAFTSHFILITMHNLVQSIAILSLPTRELSIVQAHVNGLFGLMGTWFYENEEIKHKSMTPN